MFDIHLRKILCVYCCGHAGVKGHMTEQIDWRAKHLSQVTCILKGLKCWVWDTTCRHMPRTSHHRSPGGERHRKGKHSTIFLERMRKGHRQWDQHWNCFKGNTGETPEKQGGAHIYMGLPERIDTILNWTELVLLLLLSSFGPFSCLLSIHFFQIFFLEILDRLMTCVSELTRVMFRQVRNPEMTLTGL